jgi:hypothetical protein
MQISFGEAVMNSRANLILLAAIALAACSSGPEQAMVMAPVMKVDKPFPPGSEVLSGRKRQAGSRSKLRQAQ